MDFPKIAPGNKHFFALSLLHILNDGYLASFLLLLPFIAISQGLDLSQVGFLGTILNSASVLLAMPAGYIAAKFGGLKTLIFALAVYGFGLLGCGMLGSSYLIIVMYALGGIGFGVFHPIAFALIAKWSPKATRGKNMGNFTAIGDVGRIAIATALSFIVVVIGWQQTAVLYAVIALIVDAIFYYFFCKPKRHYTHHRTLHSTNEPRANHSQQTLYTSHNHRRIGLIRKRVTICVPAVSAHSTRH